MTRLPTHPFTGLTAIGFRRDGRPIYPVKGGSEDTPPTPPGDPVPPPTPSPAPTPAPPDGPKPADPLGPGGLKALQAERERVKALEQQLAGLAPLQQLAEALGAKADPKNGRSEVDALRERFDQQERLLAEERSGRWRAEVAQEIGLSPQLAGRLTGNTREELLDDARALAALIPAAPAAPKAPAADPSQGSRGTPPDDLENQIAEATKAGNVRLVIALQKRKLSALR